MLSRSGVFILLGERLRQRGEPPNKKTTRQGNAPSRFYAYEKAPPSGGVFLDTILLSIESLTVNFSLKKIRSLNPILKT
jgi:hypothetical protein